MQQRQKGFILFALGTLATLMVLAAYLPGLSSGLHFDDRSNLDGLAYVTDRHSATEFVFSGEAGPTGRPISLVSFLPHAQVWPTNLRPILAANIAIHIFNGILVGLFAWLVATWSAAFTTKGRAPVAALAIAVIWLALPLLASSSLFLVQRMTTLATLLVMAGLCLHLLGRQNLHDRPKVAISLMTAGAIFGLGLGPLAKENAFVYPLLVLTLEHTLLARSSTTRLYRIWRIPFIIVPAGLLLVYLLGRLINSGGGYDQRHFDVTERVFTQGIILFDYLRLMVLPVGRDLGPFHDHYPIYGGFGEPLALFATVFWVAAALVAILFGRRWPIPAFAVLWFVGAHLIESTVLPLELYYEHRNYLPAVGIVLAIVFGFGQINGRAGHLVYLGFTLYAAALAFVLVQVTSLWGNPRVAAELWWDRNPTSLRAAHFLANHHTQEGFPLIAARILDHTAANDPTQLVLPLQSMRLNCTAGEHARTLELYESIIERAPNARYANRQADSDAKELETTLEAIVSGRCAALDYSDVIELASAYLSGPKTRARNNTIYNYHVLQSRAAGHQGKLDAMMEFLVSGLEYYSALDTAKLAALMAEEQGRMDFLLRIYRAISERQEPRHPLKRREWRSAISEIEDRVERMRDQKSLGH